MKKYISLSKYPGNTGKYFYTEFFKYYGIDAVYEPRGTDNLAASIDQAISEEVSGISISMPFKRDIISYLDSVTSDVLTYNSCNTINVENNQYIGYNADLAGVRYISNLLTYDDNITILGAGAIGSMVIQYLKANHFLNLNICARALGTWNRHSDRTDVIINCTALGTKEKSSPFTTIPAGIKLVIDLAINDNDLKIQCDNANVKYISGKEFYQAQFTKQFEIYTGISIDQLTYKEIESRQHKTI